MRRVRRAAQIFRRNVSRGAARGASRRVRTQNSGSLDKRAKELLSNAAIEKQKIRETAAKNKDEVINMLVQAALTVDLDADVANKK